MVSYRFVPISSQKGVLFFETPGIALFLMKCQLYFKQSLSWQKGKPIALLFEKI